jgi:uncharacterized membrane protein
MKSSKFRRYFVESTNCSMTLVATLSLLSMLLTKANSMHRKLIFAEITQFVLLFLFIIYYKSFDITGL